MLVRDDILRRCQILEAHRRISTSTNHHSAGPAPRPAPSRPAPPPPPPPHRPPAGGRPTKKKKEKKKKTISILISISISISNRFERPTKWACSSISPTSFNCFSFCVCVCASIAACDNSFNLFLISSFLMVMRSD